jgi:hypothetical protein
VLALDVVIVDVGPEEDAELVGFRAEDAVLVVVEEAADEDTNECWVEFSPAALPLRELLPLV